MYRFNYTGSFILDFVFYKIYIDRIEEIIIILEEIIKMKKNVIGLALGAVLFVGGASLGGNAVLGLQL